MLKLNLFLYRILIFVFKRRFEVNITLIHDIWRYICVEIFLIQWRWWRFKGRRWRWWTSSSYFYIFSFLIKIYFKKLNYVFFNKKKEKKDVYVLFLIKVLKLCDFLIKVLKVTLWLKLIFFYWKNWHIYLTFNVANVYYILIGWYHEGVNTP